MGVQNEWNDKRAFPKALGKFKYSKNDRNPFPSLHHYIPTATVKTADTTFPCRYRDTTQRIQQSALIHIKYGLQEKESRLMPQQTSNKSKYYYNSIRTINKHIKTAKYE